MFSKTNLELFKQRALHRVEEQLEQVGLAKPAFVASRTTNFPDERLSALLALVNSLIGALEQLLESVTVFFKGVSVLHESSKSLRRTVDAFTASEEDNEIKAHGAVLEMTFDEANVREELRDNITRPVRNNLRHLNDVRSRVKEMDILRLEAASRREAAERMRVKPSVDAGALAKCEEHFAVKQVQYEQHLLKLVDEFTELKRNHQAIFAKAFRSFKLCQYRFVMLASANLEPICGEGVDALATPNLPAEELEGVMPSQDTEGEATPAEELEEVMPSQDTEGEAAPA